MRFLFPPNSSVIQSPEEAQAEREIIDELWNMLLWGENWRETVKQIKTNNNMSKLIGYSMKAKEKREFADTPVIKFNGKGYMVSGVDKDGNKMNAIIGKENAVKAVTEGLATKEGW